MSINWVLFPVDRYHVSITCLHFLVYIQAVSFVSLDLRVSFNFAHICEQLFQAIFLDRCIMKNEKIKLLINVCIKMSRNLGSNLVDVKCFSPIIFDLGKKITTKISQKFKIFLLKSSGAGKKPCNFNRSQISQKLIFSGKPLNFKKNLIKFQH